MIFRLDNVKINIFDTRRARLSEAKNRVLSVLRRKTVRQVKNIRKYVENCGGSYLFCTKLCGLVQSGGKLKGVLTENVLTGEKSEIPVDCAVLALGHSARDSFEMLYASGVKMTAREFAVGVRIEHLAREISKALKLYRRTVTAARSRIGAPLYFALKTHTRKNIVRAEIFFFKLNH